MLAHGGKHFDENLVEEPRDERFEVKRPIVNSLRVLPTHVIVQSLLDLSLRPTLNFASRSIHLLVRPLHKLVSCWRGGRTHE